MPARFPLCAFPFDPSRVRTRVACALLGCALAFALAGGCETSRDAVDPRVNVSRISVELAFDRATPGDMPSGVSALSGQWKIVADDSAPSPKNTFVMSAGAAKQPHNIALLDDVKLADVEASVKLRALAGETDQGGGLAWRAKDAQNYYLARWSALENNVRLFKVVDGERIQLATETVHTGAGWHELKIQAKGEQLRVWLDGQSRLSARDGSFREAGKVGLWTRADAQTAFDDLKVAATK